MDASARTRRELIRRRLAAEEGFGLIEVLASAVVVVIVAIGVLAGLDAASATSGTSKARAMAAALAQEDQERMRALPVGDLSNLRATRSEARAGADYTVASRADWITDRSGATSCTSDARADYLKISSTVTWNDMRGVPPVRATSLVAPPVGSFGPGDGSLALEVLDRDGVGVPDLGVGLSGPRSGSEATNELGCVFWGHIPVGQYQLDLARPGWVTPEGVNAVGLPAEVIGEAVSTQTLYYDRQASVTVTFRSQVGPTPVADEGEVLTFANSGLAAGQRPFGGATGAASVEADGLFPFANPYRIYSGTCLAADPTRYPGGSLAQVTLSPGATAAVTVWEPPLNLVVVGAAAGGASVTATPTDPVCGGPIELGTTRSTLAKPGLPYGTYHVTVDDGSRRATFCNVANARRTGTPPLVAALGTTGSAPCP